MKKTVVFFVALVAIMLLLSSCVTERHGVCYVKGYSTAHQKVYSNTGKSHKQHAVKCNDGAVFATYKKF